MDAGLQACLDYSPLADLLEASRHGFRLYELMHLRGTADGLNYIDAAVESSTPERYDWWPPALHAASGPSRLALGILDPAWPTAPPRSMLHAAATGLANVWIGIGVAKKRVRASSDALVCEELALIDAGRHPNDEALRRWRQSGELERHFRLRPQRRYSAAFYRVVARLLAHPGVDAFTLRGTGDLFLLRMACVAQRERAGASSRPRGEAFPVRVLGRIGGPGFDPDSGELVSLDPYPSWMADVRWQFEGLRPQGLFLDERGNGGSDVDPGAAVPVLARLDPLQRRSASRAWFACGDEAWFGVLRDRLDEFARAVEGDGVRPA
jgi:hypothetical protein